MEKIDRAERKLVAILAADVVGYSKLMGSDETGTLARLKALRASVFDPSVAEYHGRIVKLIGDGALIEFPSVVDAVACAVDIQNSLHLANKSEPKTILLQFRIGINLGDVIIDGDDVYGDGVNIAARLEGLSEPGGIVLSGTAYDQVVNKLSLAFKSLGDQRLKNIAKPVRAYRIVPNGVAQTATYIEPRWRLPLVGSVVAIGLVAAWPWLQSIGSTLQTVTSLIFNQTTAKPTIAVIPFESATDDTSQDYFADGLTTDLITDLSKVSGLTVIARHSAFTFKNQQISAQDIATQLNVRYLLQGNVRRAGEKVRVNVKLIDSRTGASLWAERYDSDYVKFFDLQDKLVRNVVDALSVRLTESENSQMARLPTRNLEAYEYYMRAEQKAYSTNLRSVSESLSLYQRAISLDPEFAEAYAGYSRAVGDVLIYDFQYVMPSAVARQTAFEAAGRALDLNPKLARAYTVLGILQVLDQEFDRAIESVQMAEKLDPNGADPKLNLAIVLTYAGQNEAALNAMQRLLLVDPKPRPQVSSYYALVLYMNGQYEQAARVLAAVPAENLGSQGAEVLAMTNVRLGHLDEARRAAALLLAQLPGQNLASLRVMYGHHRRREDLENRLEALRIAGIPDWAFGFTENTVDRLDGEAIRAIAMGKTWMGHLQTGVAFVMQLSPNGDFGQRAQSALIAGRYSIEGAQLCTKSTAILLGRKFCSPVFKNPSADPKEKPSYLSPDAYSIKNFTVNN